MEEAIERTPGLLELKDQIRLELIADGLSIQIVDAKNRPMFASGSAVVQAYMRDLLRAIGSLLNEVENPISLTGHTDSAPYVGGNRGYSNWELSADRANASRRELVAGGMNAEKVLRVMGVGPVVPLDKTQPLDPMNRRIAIVVLNQSAELRILRGSEFSIEDAAELTKALAEKALKDRTPLERVLGVHAPMADSVLTADQAPTVVRSGEPGSADTPIVVPETQATHSTLRESGLSAEEAILR
jgi:chemotaxis protein MotB